MQDLVISGKMLEAMHLTPKELLIDLAAYLYDREKLSLGQAKKLAGLRQIDFQKELAKRNISIKLDVEDFEEELKSVKTLQ